MKGNKVKTALNKCKINEYNDCGPSCPYYTDSHCKETLRVDTLEYIKFLEDRLEYIAGKSTPKGFLTTEEKIKLYHE